MRRTRLATLCGGGDLVQPFVEGLADIVDMAATRKAGLTLGVDPLRY